ncbi:hypothetical protein QMI71_004414 [Salmonella enterica]|nr:hypothetical protein [Salmonella enterica]
MKGAIILVIGILGIVAVAMWGERLIWINADSYPKALAIDLYVDIDNPQQSAGELMNIAENQCGKDKGFLQFTKKKNGYFLRCDDFWQKGMYSIRFKNISKE